MNVITCIDVETTGLNTKLDHIIQLSLANIKVDTFEEIEHYNVYILPEGNFDITPSAEERHGISKEYLLQNGKHLRDVAGDIIKIVNKSDAYLTYNGNTFDFKFLVKDFEEVEYEFPLDRPCFDAYGMECKMNPRDLTSTYKKYTGKDLEGAHDALNDVRATVQVFSKQVKLLENQGVTFEDIREWKENKLLDPSGFIRDAAVGTEEMKLVFACGKYKDSEIYEILIKDPSYISWWSKEIAPTYTKELVKNYLKKMRDKSK